MALGPLSAGRERIAQVELLRSQEETELARLVGVISFNQVFDDSATLPDGKVGVWVVDRWEPAIRVEGFVVGLFQLIHRNNNALKG